MSDGKAKMLVGRGPGTVEIPDSDLTPGCLPVKVMATGETVFTAELAEDQLARVIASAPVLFPGELPPVVVAMVANLVELWRPVFGWGVERWEQVVRTSPAPWDLLPRYGAAGVVAADFARRHAGTDPLSQVKRTSVGMAALLWVAGTTADQARRIVPGVFADGAVDATFPILTVAYPTDDVTGLTARLRSSFEPAPEPEPGILALLWELFLTFFRRR